MEKYNTWHLITTKQRREKGGPKPKQPIHDVMHIYRSSIRMTTLDLLLSPPVCHPLPPLPPQTNTHIPHVISRSSLPNHIRIVSYPYLHFTSRQLRTRHKNETRRKESKSSTSIIPTQRNRNTRTCINRLLRQHHRRRLRRHTRRHIRKRRRAAYRRNDGKWENRAH
jgi:hypothetical protein